MMARRILLCATLLAGAAGGLALFGWHSSAADAGVAQVERPTPPGVTFRTTIPAENRRAFFGELHLHTEMSFDAWPAGTRLTPAQAYAFGRGDTIMVPAVQVQQQQGVAANGFVPARRAWPLDFMAVTDHSDSMGIMRQAANPGFAQTPLGQLILKNPGALIGQMFAYRLGVLKSLPAGLSDPAVMGQAWRETIEAANRANRPGRFTALIGYEWTAVGPVTGGAGNLHRNVIFNSNDAPTPFTTEQTMRPEDLWRYLESVRAGGRDVLAIPHNGNASGGLMYDWNDSDKRPIDEAYAQRRVTNEPLSEIAQVKGQSETRPVLSPTDEFADFEVWDKLLGGGPSAPNGSYIRQAYGRGLVIQSRVGVNPYKFGLVGGSDIHNGMSTSSENATAGSHAGIDPKTMMPKGDAARRVLRLPAAEKAPASSTGKGKGVRDIESEDLVYGSGALTGVWAEQNTRNSIFAALKRKETFATSGSRIRVRMFGGWAFDRGLLRKRDWVRLAYAGGTPMGGDLPPRTTSAGAPSFLLQAMKDPDGANLDRLQVIKVWLDGGDYKEKVFDVAVSGNRRIDPATHRAAAVGNTVDLKTGKYANSIGAATFFTLWSDPEFDPKTPAVYYARAIEIPTPRWSTLLAIRNQLPLPPKAAATIQERAWSSPIWFTPNAQF